MTFDPKAARAVLVSNNVGLIRSILAGDAHSCDQRRRAFNAAGQLMRYHKAALDGIDSQAEQIKRLGDALVEERAKHVAASELTDEQRAAISRAIRCMTDPNYHFAPEERKHVAVLRAMLEVGKR